MGLSKNNYLIGIIFFIALLIRVIYVIGNNDVPEGDALRYDMLGSSLSEGKGYTLWEGEPHSFSPPFYPAFLSVIYRLFGHNYLAVRIIQAIIGSFNCVLIYVIASALINSRVGIIASVISVIYFPFIKSAELLLTELFFTFLLLLITLFLVKTRKAASYKSAAILGVLLGIATLTKAMMILYVLFVIPVFFPGIKKYLITLAFFLMCIIPWTIRNFVVFHKFIPIATQGGITLYSGYRPPGGVFGNLAGQEDPVVAEADKISSPSERSDFLVKNTILFIKKNPAKVLTLEVKKILYFWAPFDWEIVGDKWFNLIYVLSAPFFIYGLFLVLGQYAFMDFYPILLPIAYFQVIALIFYGSPRFRLPVEPFLFIISALGILMVYGKLIKNRVKV